MGFWRRDKRRQDQARTSDWFRDAVRFYRQLGFFEEHKALSEDDLVTTLREFMREAYYEPPDSSRRSADPEVMRLDDDRVWWDDMEADVCAENEVYSELLPRLSAISRGALTIGEVTETWEGERGPVSVEFTANGTRHLIHPEFQEDWIAPNFLEEVGRLLEGSPFRFYTWDTQGQDLFLVALTRDEAERIQRERGVKVEPL